MKLNDTEIADVIKWARETADMIDGKSFGARKATDILRMHADIIENLKRERDHWRYAAETAAMVTTRRTEFKDSDE